MCNPITTLAVVFACLLYIDAQAQQVPQTDSVIHIAGVVLSGDSLQPLINAHVIVNQQRATLSGNMGYFAIGAQPGDTVVVSYVGYQTKILLIPKELNSTEYYTYVVLDKDTLSINEVVINPWPTKQQFRAAFMNHRTQNKEQEVAQYNIDLMLFQANDPAVVLAQPAPTNPTYANRPGPPLPQQYRTVGTLSPIALVIWAVKAARGDYKPKTYQDLKRQQKYE